jgi:hypothetical protein
VRVESVEPERQKFILRSRVNDMQGVESSRTHPSSLRKNEIGSTAVLSCFGSIPFAGP